MAKRGAKRYASRSEAERLHPHTKRSVLALALLGAAAILVLAGMDKAGPAGSFLAEGLTALFGLGYFILPLACALLALLFLTSQREFRVGISFLGTVLFLFAALGLIDIVAPGRGGLLGLTLGALRYPFGSVAAGILAVVALAIGAVVAANVPLTFAWKKPDAETPEAGPLPTVSVKPLEAEFSTPDEGETDEVPVAQKPSAPPLFRLRQTRPPKFADYVPPPLDLLKSIVEKPTTGDLRANANIVKRTLEGFGIAVEMSEVNIGPKVTRYTLKPAEGVKLSRITALHQDLALALAAHPIRIEAPIPGKSLVGIEVPNKAAAVVRLGSLMHYPDFQSSGLLGFALGRDVSGEPVFGDIERMPHLLIAGSTGSGKSVMIHSLLLSLLYKNSPATLKLVLIDPKRVELSVYEGLPHLVAPVITENKKAAGVFRWSIQEMERRYDLLQAAGSRDVKSYNENGGKEDPLPYLVIVIDELADLMTSYGREVEGSVVRLAQMARATGIHLVLSTQRPSVEVITGLIKANITSRIALQVASQIDSRTILDAAGAEKLLGGGDLLFVSSELSKPKRIQGAYITEEEIHAVADFIRTQNEAPEAGASFEAAEGEMERNLFAVSGDSSDDDDLYDEAVQVIAVARKASASLLQRRLKVGYARAARLLDLMEERGLIGPGEGAKPREVFLDRSADAGDA